MDKQFHVGDRIKCRDWKDLKQSALEMSADGYGVAVIGFSDMSDDILTITALPNGRIPDENRTD